MNRRRLYTEHKYISYKLSEFSSIIAKTNFIDNHKVDEIITIFQTIKDLMHGHADHENNVIHPLLKEKGSTLIAKIEADHFDHYSIFKQMDELLLSVKSCGDNDEKIKLGHEYYLLFMRFVADNFVHQEYEEKIIMSELHRLYSDEDILNKVDGPVYAAMTPNDMIFMIKELFPHFNTDDKYGMLNDIYLSQPTKFNEVWQGIVSFIEEKDRITFLKNWT